MNTDRIFTFVRIYTFLVTLIIGHLTQIAEESDHYERHQKSERDHKANEVFVVPLSHTIVNKRTMVIEHFYTDITVFAMGGSRRSIDLTSGTEFKRLLDIDELLLIYFHSTHFYFLLELFKSDVSYIVREWHLVLESHEYTLSRNDARFSGGSEQ